jgi:cell wall-associated NlpC family hydrolase
MGRHIAAAAASLALLVASTPATAAPPAPSWAQAQIKLVTAHGLMAKSPASFRPNDPLTQGDLATLAWQLSGIDQPMPVDPAAPATIADLDAELVQALDLGDSAQRFLDGARAAGLVPPARFGTEAVARLLGLRFDHPAAQESLELLPDQTATRAEAAYSAAKILRDKGWEVPYVQNLVASFALPRISGWPRTVAQTAISLIGDPYVWGGTSEVPQAPFGVLVPGGFDCSGFAWRVYKLGGYADGGSLATTLRGRTTYAMSGEVPRARRIGFARLQPADLVFFGSLGPHSKPGQVDHMGVYLGGGWMIHASGQGVSLAPISSGGYRTRFAWGRRPLAEAGLVSP